MVVKRGGCSFVAKANNAEALGARAVIVYNDDGAARAALSPPGLSSLPLPGVPLFLVEQDSGPQLVVLAAAGGEVRINSSFCGGAPVRWHAANAPMPGSDIPVTYHEREGLLMLELRTDTADVGADLANHTGIIEAALQSHFGYGIVNVLETTEVSGARLLSASTVRAAHLRFQARGQGEAQPGLESALQAAFVTAGADIEVVAAKVVWIEAADGDGDTTTEGVTALAFPSDTVWIIYERCTRRGDTWLEHDCDGTCALLGRQCDATVLAAVRSEELAKMSFQRAGWYCKEFVPLDESSEATVKRAAPFYTEVARRGTCYYNPHAASQEASCSAVTLCGNPRLCSCRTRSTSAPSMGVATRPSENLQVYENGVGYLTTAVSTTAPASDHSVCWWCVAEALHDSFSFEEGALDDSAVRGVANSNLTKGPKKKPAITNGAAGRFLAPVLLALAPSWLASLS